MIILPTLPPKISVTELIPEQTRELPETVPPTDAGAIITPEAELNADEQDPFATTALK